MILVWRGRTDPDGVASRVRTSSAGLPSKAFRVDPCLPIFWGCGTDRRSAESHSDRE